MEDHGFKNQTHNSNVRSKRWEIKEEEKGRRGSTMSHNLIEGRGGPTIDEWKNLINGKRSHRSG